MIHSIPFESNRIQNYSKLIRMVFHVSLRFLMVFVLCVFFSYCFTLGPHNFSSVSTWMAYTFFTFLVAIFDVDLFFLRKQLSSVTDEIVLVMVFFVVDRNRSILPSSHSFQIDIVNTISIARGPSTECVIHFERHIVSSFLRVIFSISSGFQFSIFIFYFFLLN